MRYRVHTIGEGIDKEHAEILCGENTSLEYVGRASRNKKGPTMNITDRGNIETPEMDR